MLRHAAPAPSCNGNFWIRGWFPLRRALAVACFSLGVSFSAAHVSVAYGQEVAPAESGEATATDESDAPADADAKPEVDPGQADLDEAVIARIDAKSMKQIESVSALLESALAKGLSEENDAFAKKMLGSVMLQRSQSIAAEMMRSRGRAAAKLRDEALRSLEDAVRYDPTLVEAYLLLARFNMLPGGDRDEVTKAATKAIELLADQPTEQSAAYLLRATTYGEDQADEQLDDLNSAIKANPENLEALQLRAALRLRSEDIDGAIEDLESVLAKDPTNLQVAEEAVRQLVENNRKEDALDLITKTLEAKPNEGLLRMRGILYRMMPGKEAEALADFNKALAMQPRDPMSLLQRAEIALSRKDIKSAKADLKAATKLAPRLVEVDQAVYVRCLIAIEEGRMADAINDMQLLVGRAPDQSLTLRKVQLANLFLADERPRKAIEILTEVLDREPKNAAVLRSRGDALLAVGDHKEAIDDYERALKVTEKADNVTDEELSGILNNLAWVLATSPNDNARNGKRAIELAERAVELTNESEPHILSTLASAYAEAGDMKKAVEWSTKSVELGREQEHEQLEQLQEELDSYKAGKPWREKQETEENAVPIISADDLIDT